MAETPNANSRLACKTHKLIKAYNNIFKAKVAMEDLELMNAKMDGDFHRLLSELSSLTDKEIQKYEGLIRRVS